MNKSNSSLQQKLLANILNNNAIRLEVEGNGINGTTAVNDGLWHHVAGVYDPLATTKVALYLDGNLEASGNLTVTVNTAATGNIQIGRRCDGIHYFNGTIDEVRVWNVARTASQIANNRNVELCNSTPNLVAYFPLLDLYSAPIYWWGGMVTWDTLWIGLIGLPLVLLANWLGSRHFLRTDPQDFRRFAILLLAGLAALGLLKSVL
jgi:hypothetical protein